VVGEKTSRGNFSTKIPRVTKSLIFFWKILHHWTVLSFDWEFVTHSHALSIRCHITGSVGRFHLVENIFSVSMLQGPAISASSAISMLILSHLYCRRNHLELKYFEQISIFSYIFELEIDILYFLSVTFRSFFFQSIRR